MIDFRLGAKIGELPQEEDRSAASRETECCKEEASLEGKTIEERIEIKDEAATRERHPAEERAA